MLRLLITCLLVVVSVRTAQAAQPVWPNLAEQGKHIGGGANDVALLVAVSNYPELDGAMQVAGAVENLEAWKHWLRDVRGVPQVYTLSDMEVTAGDLLEKATQVGQLVRPGGTVWFLFVGHGMPHPEQRTALLMTRKADKRFPEHDSVALADVVKALTAKSPLRTVLVVDSCFAGGADHGGKSVFAGKQASVSVKTSALAAASAGTIMMVAGNSSQMAGPLPGAARPAFSYLLLGGLMGWADGASGTPDGAVSVEEAVSFAKGAITYSRLQQTPEFTPPSEQGTVLTKTCGVERIDVEALMSGRASSIASRSLTVECPPGTSQVGDKCLRAAECEAGATLVDGRCVRRAVAVVECPEGSTLLGGRCVRAAECEAGSSWNGAKCVRTSIGQIVCPTGATLVAGHCVKEAECPQGSVRDRKRCVRRADVVCPDGTVWDGTSCQSLPNTAIASPEISQNASAADVLTDNLENRQWAGPGAEQGWRWGVSASPVAYGQLAKYGGNKYEANGYGFGYPGFEFGLLGLRRFAHWELEVGALFSGLVEIGSESLGTGGNGSAGKGFLGTMLTSQAILNLNDWFAMSSGVTIGFGKSTVWSELIGLDVAAARFRLGRERRLELSASARIAEVRSSDWQYGSLSSELLLLTTQLRVSYLFF